MICVLCILHAAIACIVTDSEIGPTQDLPADWMTPANPSGPASFPLDPDVVPDSDADSDPEARVPGDDAMGLQSIPRTNRPHSGVTQDAEPLQAEGLPPQQSSPRFAETGPRIPQVDLVACSNLVRPREQGVNE